jgi:phosphatidylglycerophosphatase A
LDPSHRDGGQRHVTQVTQNRVVVFLARFVATAGGAGFAPVAPGTAGTLVAVPLAWALAGLSLPVYAAVTAGVTLLAIACAGIADRSWGTHDSGRIVIDEVAGYLVTMALVPRDRLLPLAAGFLLFRLLDITKPPPARWIDRRLPGGAGVVLDDVTVGVYGAALLWLGWRLVPHAP